MARTTGRGKAKSRAKGRKKQPAPVARWLWILTILMIGSLITFLLYITYKPKTAEPASHYPPVHSTPPAGSTKPKTKFDFYEMLPNKEVNSATRSKEINPPTVPQPKEPTPAPKTTPLPTTPKPPPTPSPTQKPAEEKPAAKPTAKEWVLQIGAFSKFDDADQLKAELTLLGYPVMIQSINNKGELQFRVRSGPFAEKAEALEIQKELKAENISSQLLEE